MRHYNPESEYNREEAEHLGAQPWQLDLLAVNPDYTAWGPYEDAMYVDGSSWQSRVLLESWTEFIASWRLNDLNECVNFYFSINRESKECALCGGNGYHPKAQQIVRTFYKHSCYPGEKEWCADITEDEAKALVDAGRGFKGSTTAAEFNANQHKGGLGSHDAINRHILIEQRLKRLGIPKTCPECSGNGYGFVASEPHVALTLWWLHPRKGCSRGLEIKRIEQADLPAVRTFLAEAAQRNADRFAKLVNLPTE